MPVTPDVLFSFAVSIAVLSILVLGYGVIRRALPGTSLAPQVLGGLFGAVAVAQMHVPMEPIPGIIVDLRTVPLVLAGAFLGLRATVIAMIIAATARLGIGGIGWVPGVLAIMIAGTSGLLWTYLTRGRTRRGARAMLGLAGLACLQLSAVVMLPGHMALWYLKMAAPILVPCYVLVIPPLAWALERHRLRSAGDARARGAKAMELNSLLPPPEALARSLAAAEVAGHYRRGVTVLGLRLPGRGLRLGLWGGTAEFSILADLGRFLMDILPEGATIGRLENDLVLIYLPRQTPDSVAALSAELRDRITLRRFAVPGMMAVRLIPRVSTCSYATIPTFSSLSSDLGLTSGLLGARWAERWQTSPDSDEDTSHRAGATTTRLFQTADRLLEACEVDRRLSDRGYDTI
ncbi:hypothetical protein JANAI62_06760 [Jannaschia pagri]|uniref:Signal transduction histidine kinase 5TM receptor LytS transmembrane region domain-containing protein n=1 Tax=Jannaschia pagri TaxID=2829797 RepID=A0ABQ4NI02_9RHOB|nr:MULTISPECIES: LytS/YhcK type 5TM receptor domain-containing protein [unclassified Jannaschia]GIT89840.1 hypothetical protein JANAI61_02980 [Jannaschia sp. AI_61]GIT94053.1 hypothetical protein JANAI62_06760 [Jannaschia sp. AI_62]